MGRINKFLRILFLCILVLSLNTGCSNKKVETKKDTTQQKEEQTIDVFGIINATNIENINIDFPAKVEKLYVKEGQKVKFGESLVGLSIKDYESQIKSKELELDNANYELRSGILDYQKLLDDLKHAEVEVNKALKDFDSQKTMFESGSVAKKDMDDAESILNSKKKMLSDININLEKYSEKNNSIQNQKNKISHIQNDLARLKEKINIKYFRNNTIICDIKNAIAYDISFSVGDIVNFSTQTSKSILTLMDIDSMIVQADVPEEFIKEVKIDTDVIISPTADPSRKYKGKVSRVSSMAIKKNGETVVPVDIKFNNTDGFLMPNFNVDVKIITTTLTK